MKQVSRLVTKSGDMLKSNLECNYFIYNAKGGGYINLSSDIPTLDDMVGCLGGVQNEKSQSIHLI